jgi:membrane associated rhomboid family serine protease
VPERLKCYRHPDRETGVSCSECGRGICPDCMVFAPVGIRCPDHAASGVKRSPVSPRQAGRQLLGSGDAIVTRALVIINVGVFFLCLFEGGTLNNTAQGHLFVDYSLIGHAHLTNGQPVGVAEGEWYRVITATFLHASLIHVGLNMLMLYWIGTPMERAIGHLRFLLIYLVSGLCASAAVLVFQPDVPTVGASGAIFGILGAALVYERQHTMVLGGAAFSIIAINVLFSFVGTNISITGHIGGLVGGALCGLALTQAGRVHAAYGKPGLLGFAGVAAVALGAVLLSYMAVQSY